MHTHPLCNEIMKSEMPCLIKNGFLRNLIFATNTLCGKESWQEWPHSPCYSRSSLTANGHSRSCPVSLFLGYWIHLVCIHLRKRTMKKKHPLRECVTEGITSNGCIYRRFLWSNDNRCLLRQCRDIAQSDVSFIGRQGEERYAVRDLKGIQ